MRLKQDEIYNADVDLDDMEYNEGTKVRVSKKLSLIILYNFFFFTNRNEIIFYTMSL
jgi:hypothetical protein